MTLLDKLRDGLAGRYEVERELGRGGMAVVFLGRDVKHDRAVAIKVLPPDLSAAVGQERFSREIQIEASLQHPHILPLYDSGDAGGVLYYVMPFVEGESLHDRLEREGQLPLADALDIAQQVAGALHYAHGRGVVHRDIKPENILLSGGQALLADFGIARAANVGDVDRLTVTGLAVGTPLYMSPEQAGGERNLDGRSDIYSLACVVYEMLAGHPPFTGSNLQEVFARHALDPVPSLRAARATVQDPLEQTLIKALAKQPADRFQTAADFAAALTGRTGTDTPLPRVTFGARSRRARRSTLAAGITLVTVLMSGGAWMAWSRLSAPSHADSDLVAIAPFDVVGADTALNVWRADLMGLLSRNLHGAGPLRAVSASVVSRRWRGQADAVSAQRLGRRTGAGIAVYGTIVRSGPDSVRLSVSVLDVASGAAMGDVETRGSPARMSDIADSLAMGILRQLGRSRPIGAVRLASMQSASFPALKAYLQGEQHFRRTTWDSAKAYYERAVELDPTFALGFHKLFLARYAHGTGKDSLIWKQGLHVGQLNHDLTERDSLVVNVDSVLSARQMAGSDRTTLQARLYATLELAARRFPDDAEIWYLLGLVTYRIGGGPYASAQRQLDVLDRSIELDSAFAPAYVHAMELAAAVRGTAESRRYIAAFLALNPLGAEADGARLALRVLDPTLAHTAETQRLLDASTPLVLFKALQPLTWLPDSGESGIRVAERLVVRAAEPQNTEMTIHPVLSRQMLAEALSKRGRVREAFVALGSLLAPPYAELTVLGGVPPDSAARVFRRALERPDRRLAEALPFWLQSGDTALLHDAQDVANAALRHETTGAGRLMAQYIVRSASAYLALSRGDTSEALRSLESLPDSACRCATERLTRARLLAAAGRNLDVLTLLADEPGVRLGPTSLLLRLEKARAAEKLGDRVTATREYIHIVDAWSNADPHLQGAVIEAREGLVRLMPAR